MALVLENRSCITIRNQLGIHLVSFESGIHLRTSHCDPQIALADEKNFCDKPFQQPKQKSLSSTEEATTNDSQQHAPSLALRKNFTIFETFLSSSIR